MLNVVEVFSLISDPDNVLAAGDKSDKKLFA